MTTVEIPTALSAAETRLLRRYAEGRRVVEAGALLGFSTVHLAQVAAHVISIDKHEGYGAPTLGKFLRNLQRYGVNDRVRVRVGDCMVELPKADADLAFIDLDGEFGTIRRAIKLTTAPLVALHDYNRPHCDGVAEAIAATGLDIVARVDTLAIGRKR